MKLNHKIIGEGKPLIILHGVFGSLDNWFSVGKSLSESRKVILVDLRNHGQSPHNSVFNYGVMAEDVVELIEDLVFDRVDLMGHSMGGKVAMEVATRFTPLVDRLIVVDIGPKKYPPHHEDIYKGFRSLNLQKLTSRNEADQLLSEKIADFGVRQFMLKNLNRKSEGGFEWKLNLDAIESNASEIGAPLTSEAQFPGKTLFIGGARSRYIQQEDYSLIAKHFPQSHIEMVADAGHWVHAEKPSELQKIIEKFLAS